MNLSNNKEKWMAVVGLLDGRPYEIFTGKIEDVFVLPQSVEYGWVVKNKKEGKCPENALEFSRNSNVFSRDFPSFLFSTVSSKSEK